MVLPLIVGAALGAASSVAESATTNAITQFGSENDAFTAQILNLSRFSFKRVPGTGSPVRGQWMNAPSDLTSLFDVVKDHPDATKEQIEEIVEALGDAGHDLRPWSICTLARAGGLWGPAGMICYDVFDSQGAATGDMLGFMMLIRPGWDYTAGVVIGRKDHINNKYVLAFDDGNSWYLYKAIEDDPNVSGDQAHPSMMKYFSTGEFKTVDHTVSGTARLTVAFQPGKVVRFKIESPPAA